MQNLQTGADPGEGVSQLRDQVRNNKNKLQARRFFSLSSTSIQGNFAKIDLETWKFRKFDVNSLIYFLAFLVR